MADVIDRASDQEDLMRQSALNFQRKQAKPAAVATGFCLYCDEPTKPEQRWCNAECRDAWEWEQTRR